MSNRVLVWYFYVYFPLGFRRTQVENFLQLTFIQFNNLQFYLINNILIRFLDWVCYFLHTLVKPQQLQATLAAKISCSLPKDVIIRKK